MLATKQMVLIGAMVTLLYPVHGVRNILKRRTGQVVKRGKGWFTLQLNDGSYRTFSHRRCVDLKIAE
jgi:hypothetical protein